MNTIDFKLLGVEELEEVQLEEIKGGAFNLWKLLGFIEGYVSESMKDPNYYASCFVGA
ncbi:hypothetical protein FACS1894155_00240 [Bacteroidia bacterium]|nr:hypothetical protein FACS1894155_00240 [Bacteroidia bacterium]